MDTVERRELSFSHLAEVVAEIERLAAGEVRTTGKHSFAEIVRHLARANDMVTGRLEPPRPPLIFRLLLPFLRSSILNGPVRPGFKLPPQAEAFFWPADPIGVEEAVATFRDSVAYYEQRGPLPVHPMFGKASRAQIDRLTLAHAAMHLSHVHPQSE